MAVRYVKSVVAYLTTKTGRVQLLWGDACQVVKAGSKDSVVRVRGVEGKIDNQHLGDESLLELYVIDVGQGDGVLMKTPDGRWHLIDAGVASEDQHTKKGAPNFLRWKFLEDLGQTAVTLDNVIMTHADYDHYGGLINVLGGHLPAAGSRPERTFAVSVDSLYHNGMGRFRGADPLGKTQPGSVAPFPRGHRGIARDGTFITELLNGKDDFRNPARPLEGSFAQCAALVGKVPKCVRRLSASDEYLPGYRPEQGACVIRVLGPIAERIDANTIGLRELGSASETRNGHSIVLRIEYGACRILLTGDLNTASQHLLLSYVADSQFTTDVAKGCHHGSDEIDLEFVKAMAARATVISSGDDESYAHPRPRVMGASARYGRESITPSGAILPPLLYSTELARSVALGYADAFEFDYKSGGQKVSAKVKPADARFDPPGKGTALRPLGETPLALDLVYGLVNMRTDGNLILLATMRESGNQFEYQVFRAGVSP
jgi:beta-lactamase superfamily II metal-dependent hydrolase